MRNLKKILALALALVMTLSVMSVAGAKKLDDYTDSASVSAEYEKAVNVATQLGVLNGMTETEFGASGYLTRVQLAAIIYRLTTGDVDDTYRDNFVAGAAANFDDVTDDYWAAGYIGYCADAGFLEGWGGKFWPGETMRGYEALAALLRAIGYNQPDQFSGTAWTVAVAQIARDTGVSDGVVTDLNKPITREQFAQFIYNALWTPMVSWTPAYGYQTAYVDSDETTVKTLVLNTFGITSPKKGVAGEADKWGRPTTKWTGTKKFSISIADDYVARYTTMVDECDIAEELGLEEAAAIESAWIDGQKYYTNDKDDPDLVNADITTDQDGDIDPLKTTSQVGAQGRITEVYDMGTDAAGVQQLRLVEINTYLARVETIVPSKLDKNEHPTDAYSVLSVFVPATKDARDDGALTDAAAANNNRQVTKYTSSTSFAVGSWVLVTYNVKTTDNYVSGIQAATVGSAAAVMGWTIGRDNAVTGTTLLGTTTYQDSDKFVYVWNNEAAEGEGNDDIDTVKNGFIPTTPYTPIFDAYGNLIGLDRVSSNYLVIEKIEWKHHTTSVGEGYALANVILGDGTELDGVRIATIGVGAAAPKTATNVGDAAGDVSEGAVSDDYTNNGSPVVADDEHWDPLSVYYNHIWSYTVNADGSYNIVLAKDEEHMAVSAGADPGDPVEVNNPGDVNEVTITRGLATIYSADTQNTVVANDSTVFLIADKVTTPTGSEDTYTYTKYVGKNNVPSGTGIICAVMDNVGYASLVVVKSFVPSSSQFVAYVANENVVDYSVLGKGYQVYKLGETTPTVVYEPAGATAKFEDTVNGTGLYVFNVGTGNVMDKTAGIKALTDSTMTDIVGEESAFDSKSGIADDEMLFDRAMVKTRVLGNSLQTVEYEDLAYDEDDLDLYSGTMGDNTSGKDFNILPDTKVIRVTKVDSDENGASDEALDAGTGEGSDTFDYAIRLTEDSASSLKAGDVVIVGYTSATNANLAYHNASVIYVFEMIDDGVDTPESPAGYDITWDKDTLEYGYNATLGFWVSAAPTTDTTSGETTNDVVDWVMKVTNTSTNEVYLKRGTTLAALDETSPSTETFNDTNHIVSKGTYNIEITFTDPEDSAKTIAPIKVTYTAG